MPKRIHKFFFYTLLLGVYGIFFTVQSFYNFEGQGNAQGYFHSIGLSHGGENHVTVASSTPLHSGSSHSIRLNKRYHQENIPPCPVLSPAVPEYVIVPLVLGKDTRKNLARPSILHRPLRGPPAVS